MLQPIGDRASDRRDLVGRSAIGPIADHGVSTGDGQIRERFLTVRAIEHVGLVNRDPRQFSAPRELLAHVKNEGTREVNVQRYKGLGEMDGEQLFQTTMDPKNRVLIQIKVEDAEKADAIFNKLMGTEVELRKNFIQTHAKFVKDLDI